MQYLELSKEDLQKEYETVSEALDRINNPSRYKYEYDKEEYPVPKSSNENVNPASFNALA